MTNTIKFFFNILLLALLLGFVNSLFSDPPRWFSAYQAGLKAMEKNDWKSAISYFEKAIKEKPEDSNKLRAFGTIFIKYFPHRDMGICYYNLKQFNKAMLELNTSVAQSSNKKAKIYLQKIVDKNALVRTENKPPNTKTSSTKTIEVIKDQKFTDDKLHSEIVGDRLSIAVLPFESQGLKNELGSIDLLDKLITGFVNLNRFKVVERALLERILEEQKLGMSGIIDASTAAEIGKGIGVDAVVVGSVTRAHDALSIDARLIDTETAAILTARDAYSQQISLQDISKMINQLAAKIKSDLPIINGYVINVSGNKITLDIGHSDGIKRGMKCHVYREGKPIVHPVTGEIIAKEINELCEVQLIDVFDAYSIADVVLTKSGPPQIRDKCIMK